VNHHHPSTKCQSRGHPYLALPAAQNHWSDWGKNK